MTSRKRQKSDGVPTLGKRIKNVIASWRRQRPEKAVVDEPEEPDSIEAVAEEKPKRKRRRRRRKKTEEQPHGEEQSQGQEQPQAQELALEHRQKQASWTPPEIPEEEGKLRFLDLPIPEPLLHAICDLGFEYCTPIQQQSLPDTLAGKDLAGRAQTGTGKTAAFLLATLTHCLHNPIEESRRGGSVRALVLAPTRELAMQIEKDAEAFCKYTNLNTLVVFGGMNYRRQQQQLQHPIDLLVATPGRLIDYMNKRLVDLSGTEIVVIDEADRMLDMGFIPDVRRIVSRCPSPGKRQTHMWSATLTENIMQLAERWMRDPITVEIESEGLVTELVEQVFYSVTEDEKLPILFWLLEKDNVERILVFANRKDHTQKLYNKLRRHGIKCALLSGDIPQKKRIRVLEEFRSGTIPVIVATDVAARGIHVDNVSHVVNYDLPFETDDYVHRVGRTGRAGESGKAISFADEYGSYIIPDLEEYLGHEIKSVMPTDEMVDHPFPPEVDVPHEHHGGGRGGGRRNNRRGGGRDRGGRGRSNHRR